MLAELCERKAHMQIPNIDVYRHVYSRAHRHVCRPSVWHVPRTIQKLPSTESKRAWHVFSCGAVGVADVSLNQTLPDVSLHQTSPDVSLNQTRAPSGQRACRHASQASGARGTRADRDRVRESAHARARTVSTFVKTHFNTHAYTNVDAHVSTHVKTHANVC